ncbi:uncharacterized protein Dana_GF26542 [Drosophila ananassae]|uniref:Serpin domain-containing protein n=1 Tax=Drosophila ananassae TaxID=7217 RepID=A0A0P8YCX9_DROAN|nr:leukocyte elastase inhibitor [Drosophila ananassae]KPU76833.1 uncharacterized protein Dana_GF26542 [Drosophila ananassae]
MKRWLGFLQILVLGVILSSVLAYWGEERIPFPKDSNFAGEIYNMARNTLPYRVKSFVISPFGILRALRLLLFAVGPTSAAEIKRILYAESDRKVDPLFSPAPGSGFNETTIALVHNDIKINPKFAKNAREMKAFVYKTRFTPRHGVLLFNYIYDKIKLKPDLHYMNDNLYESFIHDATSRLLFVNYVNFQGRFEASLNFRQDTRMLALYSHIPEVKARVLGLPFKDSNSILLVLLPDSESLEVEEALRTVDLRKLRSRLKSTLMNVRMPLIHSFLCDNNKYNLRKILGKMGLKTVFDRANVDITAFGMKQPLDGIISYSTIFMRDEGVNEVYNPPLRQNLERFKGQDGLEFNVNRRFVYAIVDSENVYIIGNYYSEIY